MADRKLYRIASSSQHATVSPGAVVTYRCQQQYATLQATDGPRDQFQWFCVNDRLTAAQFGAPHAVTGPRRAYWENAQWGFPGRHFVQCHVRFTDGDSHVYEHLQTVEPAQAILLREIERSRQEKTQSPDAVLNSLQRYIQLLKDIEKAYPITDPSKKKEHDRLVTAYEAYCTKLREVLAPTNNCHRVPIRAVHLANESQARTHLNVFIARVGTAEPQKWVLVDWTDPTDRTRTSQHEATGGSSEKAIRALLESWLDGGNRYAEGTLTYEVPPVELGGKVIKGEAKTTGKTTWDNVIGVLEWVGLAAAGVAMVVALIAPVPGSSLISAAIWTSVFSSTAAAAINIGLRHEEGFSNWQDNTLDSLTIVGNLFAGAGMWVKNATIVAKSAQGTIIRGVLIGQVATDGVQGVLIATEHIQQYDAIMKNTSLTPDERARKLLELFRSLTIAGALTYVSVKSTARDLANASTGPQYLTTQEARAAAAKLEDLKTPGKTLDTTPPPQVEAHTDQGRSKTKVDVHQRRSAIPDPPKTTIDKEFPDDGTWKQRTINREEILLIEKSPPAKKEWHFWAVYENGSVTISIEVRDLKEAGVRSERLAAHKLYPRMFQHFEDQGLPIKQWRGVFIGDNDAAVKAALAKGGSVNEAALEAKTAKYWKEWAESKGLRPVPKGEINGNGKLDFTVDFVPK